METVAHAVRGDGDLGSVDARAVSGTNVHVFVASADVRTARTEKLRVALAERGDGVARAVSRALFADDVIDQAVPSERLLVRIRALRALVFARVPSGTRIATARTVGETPSIPRAGDAIYVVFTIGLGDGETAASSDGDESNRREGFRKAHIRNHRGVHDFDVSLHTDVVVILSQSLERLQ